MSSLNELRNVSEATEPLESGARLLIDTRQPTLHSQIKKRL